MTAKKTIPAINCIVIVVDLVTTMNYGVGLLSLLLPELKTQHLRESLFQVFLEESRNVGK